MPTYSDQELLTFNQIVLQVQDRAYTLAVCLLGEVPLAASLVQAAIQESLADWHRSPHGFEARLLRSLILRCRQAGSIPGPAGLREPFNTLACEERLALILVDCLACPCPEAAAILHWPLPRLRQTLARARFNLTTRLNHPQPLSPTPASPERDTIKS